MRRAAQVPVRAAGAQGAQPGRVRVHLGLRRLPSRQVRARHPAAHSLPALLLTRTPRARSFVVTCILLFDPFYRRYGGTITIISLLSNTQLVASTVARWIQTTKTAHAETNAMSLFMSQPRCANSIDKSIVYSRELYEPPADEDAFEDAGESDDEYSDYEEGEADGEAAV